MSKLTALATVIVLGSSASAAMASTRTEYAPHPTTDRARFNRMRAPRAPDRVVRTEIRDHRWDRAPAIDASGPRRFRPNWVALSAPVQLSRASQDCIEVSDPGTFTQLRLQNDGGIDRIDRVTIRFADGSAQVADLERVLDDRGEFVEIALDGNNRRIDKILIAGAPGSRGALQVYGI
jgi:hypothetical protein